MFVYLLQTVLMLADQMIGRIEFLHNKNFIHRDIKPDNFLMGIGRHCNKLFLIDYGLAKKFRDNRTRQHIGYRFVINCIFFYRLPTIYISLDKRENKRDLIYGENLIFIRIPHKQKKVIEFYSLFSVKMVLFLPPEKIKRYIPLF